MGKLGDFAKWIVDNKDNLTWLVGIIGGVTLAVKALNVASVLLAITGTTVTAPFIALGVALGALVGALVVAYTKSETFRNIVNAAFQTVWFIVKPIIDGLIQGFKDWWAVMSWLWTKISGWAMNVWNKFNQIKSNVTRAVTETWTGIKKSFSDGIDTVVNWMKDLPSRLGKAISDGAHFVKDAFKGMFNAALKAVGGPVNGIIHGASWVLEN